MGIDFVNGQLFDITGRLISCIVSTVVIFQFFDSRYERVYGSKYLYVFSKILVCTLNVFLYYFDKPILNMCYWILIIVLISWLLFCNDKPNSIKYYLVNMSYLFAYSICESIGCVLVSSGIKILDIRQSEYIVSFVYTVGGSASAVLLHYLVLQRLFTIEKNKKISATQYFIYAIITIYVLVNIGSILFLLQHELNNKDYLFLLLDTVFVIILNLYLFYLLEAFAENRDLKYRIALYEQQAKKNYDYYAKQIESNRKALSVIHDIRKHMRVLESLKQSQISLQLQEYTDSFEALIEPLLVKQYSDSPILNIILNDKVDYCTSRGIQMEIDIAPISFEFMKPIDITTILGNILDNAIEASEKSKEKIIDLKISSFNELIYIELSNAYTGVVHMNANGRPQSKKGEGHGIGLENVENALLQYNGSIQFSVTEKLFSVEIMLCS